MFSHRDLKKIKTPSFTTSEAHLKGRGSDILLRKKEPSLIAPAMSIGNDEIIRPDEIEYFSNGAHSPSPGNSPSLNSRFGN